MLTSYRFKIRKFHCACARARTSNELKISVKAAWLACPERKDETHLLSLFITLAEFDPADQHVRSGMSVRTEVLCGGVHQIVLSEYAQSRQCKWQGSDGMRCSK